MTSMLLRQARVAAEPRVLRAQASLAKWPGAKLSSSSPPPSSPLNHQAEPALAPEVAPMVTYEAYKQRFEEDLAALREQTCAQGLEQGRQEGRQAAEAEYQDCLVALKAAMSSAQLSQQQGIEDLAESAVEIVFGAVTKILGEGGVTRSQAIGAVREVIKRCQDRSHLVIRVAAAEAKALQTERLALIEGLNAGQVEIVADELVELGGCLVDSPTGNLDGRLETQLQRLKEVLVQARAKWDEPHE